jgi:hypothetical protein
MYQTAMTLAGAITKPFYSSDAETGKLSAPTQVPVNAEIKTTARDYRPRNLMVLPRADGSGVDVIDQDKVPVDGKGVGFIPGVGKTAPKSQTNLDSIGMLGAAQEQLNLYGNILTKSLQDGGADDNGRMTNADPSAVAGYRRAAKQALGNSKLPSTVVNLINSAIDNPEGFKLRFPNIQFKDDNEKALFFRAYDSIVPAEFRDALSKYKFGR